MSAVRFSSSPPPLSGRKAFRADARPASNLASLCSKDTNLVKIVPNFRQLSSSWELHYLSRIHTLTDYRGVSAFARARARMPQGCGHHRRTCKHIRSMHPTSTDSTASKNVAKSAAWVKTGPTASPNVFAIWNWWTNSMKHKHCKHACLGLLDLLLLLPPSRGRICWKILPNRFRLKSGWLFRIFVCQLEIFSSFTSCDFCQRCSMSLMLIGLDLPAQSSEHHLPQKQKIQLILCSTHKHSRVCRERKSHSARESVFCCFFWTVMHTTQSKAYKKDTAQSASLQIIDPCCSGLQR